MKKLIILLVFFFLAITGFTLDAAPRPDMTKHMKFRIPMAEQNLFPARMLLRMKDKIGLTDQQVDKIEKMQAAHREGFIQKKAEIKIMELKVKNYLKGDKIDRRELEKLIHRAADKKTALQIEHMNHLLDLRELLGKDQLDKIDKLKKNRRTMKRRGRFPRRGGGRGDDNEDRRRPMGRNVRH